MRYSFFIFLFISVNISVTALAQKDSIRFSGDTRLSSQYRFFFKGEAHEYKEENVASLFALLVYVHKANNVRYLVMEVGPDQAFIINQYLETGDEKLVKDAKPYLGEVFWKQVHAFNIKKSEKEKVKVLGFDFNRRLFTTRAISMMIDRGKLEQEKELKEVIEDVIRWDTAVADAGADRGLEKDLRRLQKLVSDNDSAAKKVFARHYQQFTDIVFNRTPAMSQVKRDKMMVAQFTDQLPWLSRGNFLFNYGIAHVFLNGVGAANILSGNKAFDQQVCSIYSYYRDEFKSKLLNKIEDDIPGRLHESLRSMEPYTLVDLKQMQVYPNHFKKTQWLLIAN